jgi:hypothetical protein
VGEANEIEKIKTYLETEKWVQWFIKPHSKITYHKDRIEVDVANKNKIDALFQFDDFYLIFKGLVRENPETSFIFDIYYHDKDGDCNRSGRYYCVYEGAKKMYDAGCWLKENESLHGKHLFNGGYGYEHYLELKKEGKLPSLNAVPTGYKFQLFFFDYDETDKEKIFELVKKEGLALEDVPEKLKTYDVCLAAVRNSGWVLGYVPEKHKTAELCLEAVRQNGVALVDVPEEQKTAELCFEAVRQNDGALPFVPEKLQSQVKEILEKNGVL